MNQRLLSLLSVSLLALAAVATACGDSTDEDASGQALEGTLAIEAGECGEGPEGGVATGSWFRMVQAGGTPADGPFIGNADSPCDDKTFTPLQPGADGGLRVGAHQPFPEPAFGEGNHALGDAVIQPQAFFAVNFSAGTSPVDPQTGEEVPAPRLEVDDGGELSGDLSAFGAAWNGQFFNQGVPKPDGSRPEGTTGPVGRYAPEEGTMTLEWTSLIVGGPFDGFTGVWHLEGSFEPSG